MVTFHVNGKRETVDVDDDVPLLWVLRDSLGQTGTKYGCGIAQCGACTVHVNDPADARAGDSSASAATRAVRSCVMPASSLEGRQVTTIEGVTKGPDAKRALAVQEAWRRLEVAQCGYCQSGQIMSAILLLKEIKQPSDADIDAAMSGNVCRCATYGRIRAAIHDVARKLGG